MSQNKSLLVKTFIAALSVIIVIVGFFGYQAYDDIYKPNIFPKNSKEFVYVYIPTGANYDTLVNRLKKEVDFKKESSFHFVAKMKNLFAQVHPGKYKITRGMSNNQIANMIRAGLAEQVKVVINFHRKIHRVAEKASTYIEADAKDIDSLLNNDDYLKQFDLTREQAISLFIPNTYFFKWNTSADEFIQRMHELNKKFWNEDRLKKAEELEMTPAEVSTLASIVHLESKWDDEKPRIAGVYLNRLKKGILLQADPTVVYAVNNFKLRRVLKRHLRTDSPYNTYKYKGLPPGPICIPSVASIDAVLNHEKHEYIFFCAKEDFSGYHNFAVTHKQHTANARKFQRALNNRKIYR